jgi:hypothetical protein
LTVNKIRQKYAGTDAASVAKKLIKSWKKLLPGIFLHGSKNITKI